MVEWSCLPSLMGSGLSLRLENFQAPEADRLAMLMDNRAGWNSGRAGRLGKEPRANGEFGDMGLQQGGRESVCWARGYSPN